jgi:hypothetical protein
MPLRLRWLKVQSQSPEQPRSGITLEHMLRGLSIEPGQPHVARAQPVALIDTPVPTTTTTCGWGGDRSSSLAISIKSGKRAGVMASQLSSYHVNQPFLFDGADVEWRVGEEVVDTAVGIEDAADVALALAGGDSEEGWRGRLLKGPQPLADWQRAQLEFDRDRSSRSGWEPLGSMKHSILPTPNGRIP